MSGKIFMPTSIDQHIGQRMQLRRNMLGLSQKDLANICGVTFQQIQKYEAAENRISASRLFDVSAALETPISFFFSGLPGNMPEETRANRSTRVSEQKNDDPLGKNESLLLINLYWKLPNEDQRKIVMKMLKSLNGTV
ncbi:MAG: helix-turn-helix transcriptional regulator [Alphaproteobacteria bacterium]|nr:helix-turn-helix transcriptional regulator [Alphaproteobacteria bacterium]MBN2675247.1 helix-turn-helix transcriptional regulator [Alphaproteobacteria bacterium]